MAESVPLLSHLGRSETQKTGQEEVNKRNRKLKLWTENFERKKKIKKNYIYRTPPPRHARTHTHTRALPVPTTT